jgi:5-methylcytosine-specific restriction endonuclease McrA
MGSTLVLNTDGTPVSMLPLSTIPWEEAIKYMVLDKAHVLEWHEHWIVHSATWETQVPAVIMLKEYMKKKSGIRFSKANVFLRDGYKCQYCGVETTRKTATLDHVVPTSHGGKTTFENTVCACADCNARKGNNKKIVPKKLPVKPTYFQLVEKRKHMEFDLRHPSWGAYLGLNPT